ncbi:MAG TPA: sialate O-acetylesterase, partial [Sediminibacterium sp.]|nr:sialate O-acetylesterase [Sediminibacterium sp.]
TVETKTRDGVWMVNLRPLEAGGPYVMNIVSKDTTITIQDVMVGEVWLCSGQSNMERQLGPRPPQKPIVNWEQEVQQANYPALRQYAVPERYAAEMQTDANGSWQVCSPETVPDFSAVAYFFARDLYNEIKIPVGILFAAYGGTPAEHWTNREALNSNPQLQELVSAYDKAVREYPDKLAQYSQEAIPLYRQFLEDSAKAVADSLPLPKRPAPPADPQKGHMIGGLYNAMIHPLIPYAIKGVCWYQGESNNSRAGVYASLLTTLINNWRDEWHSGKFPFLIVQIAPHKDMSPQLREAQWDVVRDVPRTALIVTTDCGDSADIHPAHKQPVGQRLAIAARALAYRAHIEYSGPAYRKMIITGNEARIVFDHAHNGLTLKNGDSVLSGFQLAGLDHRFYPAQARISHNAVILTSPKVRQAAEVRFGWENVPHVNLYNTEGLPAIPFRTDR